MLVKDNGLRFSPITVFLHWIVALLFVAIAGISVAMVGAGTVQKSELAEIQNLLGLLLFVVSVYRFWARITSYHPMPVGTPNPAEVIVSRSVAVGLALAMVLLPVAAWLVKSAAGEVIGLPGGWTIPAAFGRNESALSVFAFLFKAGSIAFLLGLALHIFGACKNHFVLKNDSLKRMLGKHVEL